MPARKRSASKKVLPRTPLPLKLKLHVLDLHDPDDDPECNGDPVTILFIDGQEVFHGDYYHDKIDEKIGGFIEALEYLKIPYEKTKESAADERYWNYI